MPERAARSMLVTGASGDVGAHLARHFLARGWTVLGLDRHEPAAGSMDGLIFNMCDLTDGASAVSAIDRLAGAHGAVDVLVNCAGVIANAPLVSLGADGWQVHDFGLWQDVLAGSLTTAFHATALTVKHMLAAHRKGVVVNVSSVCAKGNPGQAAYSAAKAGLDGFTRALAKELGPVGIRVVGLAPGYFDTNSTRSHMAPAKLTKVTSAIPLKRLGVLDEISNAVTFIIENEYVNGTIVEVNGGLVL